MSSATEKAPLLRDSKPTTKLPKQEFILRPMTLYDIPILAENKRLAYWLSPLNKFIFPGAPEQ